MYKMSLVDNSSSSSSNLAVSALPSQTQQVKKYKDKPLISFDINMNKIHFLSVVYCSNASRIAVRRFETHSLKMKIAVRCFEHTL